VEYVVSKWTVAPRGYGCLQLCETKYGLLTEFLCWFLGNTANAHASVHADDGMDRQTRLVEMLR